MEKRSPACSHAGDRLEGSLLAVEATCAGKWEVGADGLTAVGVGWCGDEL